MCHVGASNEGHSCKWVLNEASLTPWCHAVLHFEVKMSRFPACACTVTVPLRCCEAPPTLPLRTIALRSTAVAHHHTAVAHRHGSLHTPFTTGALF